MSKQLTAKEFNKRVTAVNRAMKIFGELTNHNMTKAFIAYQEVFEEKEMEVFIAANRFPEFVDENRKFKNIKCPDCGHYLLFRPVPPNDDGVKSQLVCSNNECDTVLNSEHDLRWWRKELTVKNNEKKEATPEGA